jgi:lipooligosaccharide transport system ATP-binding protein
MHSHDTSLIYARGLTKRFGAFTAVDRISFDVHQGEAFGFLGPNGAGKTSTMRMIACASPVTAGDLRVLDMSPHSHASRIKARLGVVPQQDNLDTEITVRENLLMYARYFDIPRTIAQTRADELLDFVELRDRAGAQVESLSGGMKRRLTIARALVNEPEVILLDEPTTGLDPQARHVVWDRLYQLKRRGATLLLTTHYMDEAERLCDRLVVMDKATIVAEGSPRELIARYSTREVLELRFAAPSHLPEPAASARQAVEEKLTGIGDRVELLPDRVQIYTEDGEHALQQVHARDIPLESALVRPSTLEDVFLRITGRALIE